MDPVSLIAAALAAGAMAGAQNTATNAVKDAYADLKALARRRLAGRQTGETAVEPADGRLLDLQGVHQRRGIDGQRDLLAVAGRVRGEEAGGAVAAQVGDDHAAQAAPAQGARAVGPMQSQPLAFVEVGDTGRQDRNRAMWSKALSLPRSQQEPLGATAAILRWHRGFQKARNAQGLDHMLLEWPGTD